MIIDKEHLVRLSKAADDSARKAANESRFSSVSYFQGQRDAYALLAANIDEAPKQNVDLAGIYVCLAQPMCTEVLKLSGTMPCPKHPDLLMVAADTLPEPTPNNETSAENHWCGKAGDYVPWSQSSCTTEAAIAFKRASEHIETSLESRES